jgi:hypothetical protein
MPPTNDAIHAVIFRSGEWLVAQCLEYDIATQARELRDLLNEVERIVAAHILVAAKDGTEPFVDIPKAPKRFWQMYKNATAKVEPLRRPAEFPAAPHPPLELRAA